MNIEHLKTRLQGRAVSRVGVISIQVQSTEAFSMRKI